MLCDDGECTLICEGVIDALTVAGIRIRSVALLSAGDAGHGLGELTVLDGRVLIATDPDEAGRAAADSLRRSLAESGTRMVHQLNLPADVNDFARRLGDRFEEQFRSTVRELAVKPENSASLGR
jgi:LmbE family N-acetylglucosaminyl deacetylase